MITAVVQQEEIRGIKWIVRLLFDHTRREGGGGGGETHTMRQIYYEVLIYVAGNGYFDE